MPWAPSRNFIKLRLELNFYFPELTTTLYHDIGGIVFTK